MGAGSECRAHPAPGLASAPDRVGYPYLVLRDVRKAQRPGEHSPRGWPRFRWVGPTTALPGRAGGFMNGSPIEGVTRHACLKRAFGELG